MQIDQINYVWAIKGHLGSFSPFIVQIQEQKLSRKCCLISGKRPRTNFKKINLIHMKYI